jgi:predicted RNase H-like HicB family nuclease
MDTDVVRVAYHEDQGMWWADSEDVDGFMATGNNLGDVRALVREGLAFHLGHAVEVRESRATSDALVYEVSISSFDWSPTKALGPATTVSDGARSARGPWQALASA